MQTRRPSRIRTWLQAGVQRVNRLSVSLRLGILLGLLCLLMAGIGLVGLQGMHSAGDGIKAVYKDRIVPLQQIKTISDGYARISTTAMKVRFGDFSPEQGAEAIGRARKLIARAWKNFQTHPKEGEEAELTSRFEQLQQPAEAAMDELETMAKSDANPVDLEAVGKFTSQVILPSLDPLQGVLEQLASLQLDQAKAVYEETDKRIVLARTLVWATIGTGLLLALGLGLAVTWSVLAQLGGEPREAAKLANAVAEGDLTQSRAHFRGGPESLMAQLGSMQLRLAEVVRSVFHVSSTVANASREIAQGNYDLSARTEEQASALQQTAASMEQLSSTVEKNAAHSRQAQALAQTASDVASQGGQVVGRVVENMHSIRTSAYRISDIIAVIEGIAFQTNILALNAAVEAARAGEQGRGFAVVASEVRTLASRSAAAAKEIKQLITDSVQHVDAGAGLVNEAGSTMDEIVRSIARVCTIMAEISTASQDQASGVSQVGHAVGQMDKTTQANAALVEQMAASAASLSSQANELVHIVSVFKMDEEPALALTH